jgi:DMSO reductase family type II enzyme heme b subunit
MGDAHNPARLYYWNASRGAAVLTASGRATPQPTGEKFTHRARHGAGKWTLTLELPALADGYPVAFAIWDGQFGDRDGLKFFSVWYVLNRAAP